MQIGVEDVPYNRHFIPLMTGETQKKIYETKIAPPGEEPRFYNTTYGIAKLREVNKTYFYATIQQIV